MDEHLHQVLALQELNVSRSTDETVQVGLFNSKVNVNAIQDIWGDSGANILSHLHVVCSVFPIKVNDFTLLTGQGDLFCCLFEHGRCQMERTCLGNWTQKWHFWTIRDLFPGLVWKGNNSQCCLTHHNLSFWVTANLLISSRSWGTKYQCRWWCSYWTCIPYAESWV